MSVIHMPTTFKVDDTAECKINGQPQKLTWRDQHTLVIEPNEEHRIVQRTFAGPDGKGQPVNRFICADADGSADFSIINHRQPMSVEPDELDEIRRGFDEYRRK